jgi:hypothetical protein
VVLLCAYLSMQGFCSVLGFCGVFCGGSLLGFSDGTTVLIRGEAGPESGLPKAWFLLVCFFSFYLAAWESTWHTGWTE